MPWHAGALPEGEVLNSVCAAAGIFELEQFSLQGLKAARQIEGSNCRWFELTNEFGIK